MKGNQYVNERDNTPNEVNIIEKKIARDKKLYKEYIKNGSPEMALFFLARSLAFEEVLEVL